MHKLHLQQQDAYLPLPEELVFLHKLGRSQIEIYPTLAVHCIPFCIL